MTGYPETRTIGQIVADNFRTAAVFQKHGIDFCCRGNRTIDEACAEKTIDPETVLNDLAAIDTSADDTTPRFASWEPDFLIDYIVNNHHRYVRQMLPVLRVHTRKVAAVHGERHPELLRIADAFESVAAELEMHMHKEEQILFPYIRTMVVAQRAGMTPPPPPFGSVRNPIAMMEMEHQSAGDEMELIRTLTGNYTPPEDACTTYRVTFQELHDFERDLHRHVHLENNILFPKALELENAPRNASDYGQCPVPQTCSVA
jgi:regulator of cell morphogenesis and NO signaling